MIDPVNVLELAAEISIGFVGFAGIIATLRTTENTTRSEAVGMTLIVGATFTVALGSLVMLFLIAIGIQGATLWSWASGVIATLFAIFLIMQAVSLKGSAIMRKNKASMMVAFVLGTTIMVINGLNAVGIVFQQGFAPVYAAGIWGLGLAAYFFSVMLLRPMWNTVRNNEKERAAQKADRQ